MHWQQPDGIEGCVIGAVLSSMVCVMLLKMQLCRYLLLVPLCNINIMLVVLLPQSDRYCLSDTY